MMARYGNLYLAHARNSAFGPLSAFYDDGISRFNFLIESLCTVLPLMGVLAAFAVLVAHSFLRRSTDRGRILVAGYAALVIVIYLVLAAGSPNKDPRFFWLVWLSFAADLPATSMEPSPLEKRLGGLAIVVAVLLSLPMVGRFKLEAADKCELQIVHRCRRQAGLYSKSSLYLSGL